MIGMSLLMRVVSQMRAVGVEPSRIVTGPKAYEALRYGCLIPPNARNLTFLGLPIEVRDDCPPDAAYVITPNIKVAE